MAEYRHDMPRIPACIWKRGCAGYLMGFRLLSENTAKN